MPVAFAAVALASAGRLVAALVLAAALPLATPLSAQTEPVTASRPRVRIEFASEELRRNTALATTVTVATNAVADAGMDRLFGRADGKTTGAVFKRIARVYVVNLPLAALGNFAAHELGHVARAHETNTRLYDFEITRWPWPAPITGGIIYGEPAATGLADLSITSGGAEGSLLQYQQLTDAIYSGDRADYFQWLMLAYAKLEMPAYTWGTNVQEDDPRSYAQQFGFMRRVWEFGQGRPGGGVIPVMPHADAALRTLRRGMWWNLADYALVMGVSRTIRYVATGERETANPLVRVRGWSFVPAARFTLTPIGFETGLDLRIVRPRFLTHVDVRSIDPPAGERRWALGVGVQTRRADRWGPTLRADVFPQTASVDIVSLNGTGARVEAGARGPLRIAGRRIEAGLRVGYKSEGYLLDTPYRKTLLGGISLGVQF